MIWDQNNGRKESSVLAAFRSKHVPLVVCDDCETKGEIGKEWFGSLQVLESCAIMAHEFRVLCCKVSYVCGYVRTLTHLLVSFMQALFYLGVHC